MRQTLHLPSDLRNAMLAAALAAYPHECCGLLLGKDSPRQIARVVPVRNSADAPANRYLIDPCDYLAAQTLGDSLGLDIVGVYHSHPDSPARPSEIDRTAAFGFLSYVILSVSRTDLPDLACFHLEEGAFVADAIEPG